MTTLIIGWVLVSLTSGMAVHTFKGADVAECLEACYRYALLTGHEFECVAQRKVVR